MRTGKPSNPGVRKDGSSPVGASRSPVVAALPSGERTVTAGMACGGLRVGTSRSREAGAVASGIWRGPLVRTVLGVTLLSMLWLSASGCGGRREVSLSTLEVERVSWDTVLVHVAFAERGAIGPAKEVPAEDVTVRAFDDAYRTLYDGPGPVVLLDDGSLGNRERIVLEACGTVSESTVCDQTRIEASPKRIHFAEDVTYPRFGRYDQGTYDFGFRIERTKFGSDDWEPVAASQPVNAYLVASVQGQPETSVRVPVREGRGNFDLSQFENFQEFQYRVLRALDRRETVPVQIELFAGLDEEPVQVASLERVVREKTRDERERELEMLVRAAVARVLDHFEPYDRARARVVGWEFRPESRRYDIRLSLLWGPLFADRHRIEGSLEVGEDGSEAIFTQTAMNRRTRALWDDRIGESRIALGSISIDPEEEVTSDEAFAARL